MTNAPASGFFEGTEKIIRNTAKLARKRGLDPAKLSFTLADLVDLYHVYGVNASADKFLPMLVRRNN